MEDAPNTTIVPVSEDVNVPPSLPNPPPNPEKPRGKLSLLWLVPLTIAVVGAVGILIYTQLSRSSLTSSRPPAVPLTIPTPTPERPLSAVATQSAFLALDSHVASLSAAINNFILEDPTLTPPVLDLPLGFQSQ